MEPPPVIPNEQAALLAAVVAEPDNDTPRLVYADWLDEHGGPEQAAFIRDSIRLSRSPASDPERDGLCARIERAWGAHGKSWLAPLGITGAEATDVDYCSRGFLHRPLYWCYETFRNDADLLFRHTPVEELQIYWQHGRGLDDEALAELAEMPQLSRLRGLRLANYGDDLSLDGLRTLVCSPYLTNLKLLALGCCGLTDEHARVIADCPNMVGLTALDLSDNALTEHGALAVAGSPHLTNLTRLSLAENRITEWESEETEALLEQLHTALLTRFGSLEPLDEEF